MPSSQLMAGDGADTRTIQAFRGSVVHGRPSRLPLIRFRASYDRGPSCSGPDVPDAGQVQQALAVPRSNEYLNIDIESMALEGPDQASSIAKYQKTLSAFRKADPSVKLGLYNVLPIRDHWRAIGGQGAVELDDWNIKIPRSHPPSSLMSMRYFPPCIHFTATRPPGWPMRNPISGKHEGFRRENRSTASCGRSFIRSYLGRTRASLSAARPTGIPNWTPAGSWLTESLSGVRSAAVRLTGRRKWMKKRSGGKLL